VLADEKRPDLYLNAERGDGLNTMKKLTGTWLKHLTTDERELLKECQRGILHHEERIAALRKKIRVLWHRGRGRERYGFKTGIPGSGNYKKGGREGGTIGRD